MREVGSGLSRRQLFAMLGGGAALAAESAGLAHWQPASWWGTAGTTAASGWPDSPRLRPVLLARGQRLCPGRHGGPRRPRSPGGQRCGCCPGPFLGTTRQRNLDYLQFLDPDRMLRSFRLNYGVAARRAVGGWEDPGVPYPRPRDRSPAVRPRAGLRGHRNHAGDPPAGAAKGDYLVAELRALQQKARLVSYSKGYLSAFPEVFFDYLDEGQYDRIWSPYYMIHKYLAGLIDQYQLAGNGQALEAAAQLADWVDARTRRLPLAHMQAILEVEFGGLPEALANLYAITGERRYLATAQRFWHARFLDPLVAGQDRLEGEQCNISLPKVIAALRLAEETGERGLRQRGGNFWGISTAPLLCHRRPGQPRALGRAGRGRRGAVELHGRGLRQLQHAQADPADALARAGPRGTDGLLRADAVQSHARHADPRSRTGLPAITPACRRGRSSASRSTTSRMATPMSTRPTTPPSPAIRRRGWRPRRGLPRRSTRATCAACSQPLRPVRGQLRRSGLALRQATGSPTSRWSGSRWWRAPPR